MFVRFSENSENEMEINQEAVAGNLLIFVLVIIEIVQLCAAVFLNLGVFSALWVSKRKEHSECFFTIMRTYTMYQALNAIVTLVIIFGGTYLQTMTTPLIFFITFNLTTSFSSSLWLFYAGFNRMMVLVYPNHKWTMRLFKKSMCRTTVLILCLISILSSSLYIYFCGIDANYNENTRSMEITSSNGSEYVNLVVYAFPLLSIAFYVIAYKDLRKKREIVISDKTISIIDKAERKTLRVGVIILTTYTLALVSHIAMIFIFDSSKNLIFEIVDLIISGIPQIALPSSLFSCLALPFLKKRFGNQIETETSSNGKYVTFEERLNRRSFTMTSVKTEGKLEKF